MIQNLNIDNDMPTLLEDFSNKELMFLSFVLEEKAKDLHNNIDMVYSFQDSSTKDELLQFYRSQLDMNNQWLTKIFEAQLEARNKEIIQSN